MEAGIDLQQLDSNHCVSASESRARPFARSLVAVLALTKPRIVIVSLFAAICGMLLAGARFTISECFSLTGIGLAVASACALNMAFEHKSDRRMRRTQGRPIPQGRLSVRASLVIASTFGVIGLTFQLVAGGILLAGLSLLAIVVYAFVYTPLKRRSSLAFLVGAISGSLPPVLGWVAIDGEIGLRAALLFGVLYIWQVPHVLAVSFYLRDEYEQAGIKVLPLRLNWRTTLQLIVAGTFTLLLASLWLEPLGCAGSGYSIVALVLGLTLLVWSLRGYRAEKREQWARHFFVATILYVPLLLTALVAFPGS